MAVLLFAGLQAPRSIFHPLNTFLIVPVLLEPLEEIAFKAELLINFLQSTFLRLCVC